MKKSNNVIASLMLTTLLPTTLLGAPGDGSVGNGISVLTDPQMDKIRGKYTVSANKVLYFGVEMASVWKTADGLNLQSGARLGLDFSAGSKPKVTFSPTVSIVSAPGATVRHNNGKRTITSSGIDNVTGLGQTIQVAGDFNNASNTLTVKMLDRLPDSAGDAGIGASMRISNDSGAEASSVLDERGVTVTLSLAGEGMVEQSLRGAVTGSNGGRGAFQSIRTLGDAHTIANRMQLSILMKPGTSSSNLRKTLGVSLGGLRGLQ